MRVLGAAPLSRSLWTVRAPFALALSLGGIVIAAPSPGRAQDTAFSADPATPLSEAARAVAEAVPSEDTPEPDEHYPVSNEWRHDLWFGAIRDLGGAFVGVGTDQCYTLAAVQNASMVWIVDFDAVVARVHRMYEVLVGASPTPEELVARFSDENEDATAALLEAGLAGDPEAREIVRMFRRNTGRFDGYLAHVARLRRGDAPTSWLSDPVLYGRIRALFSSHRIVARTGDVTGTTTLRAVGAAARALGVPVRALYFSNAEQFFRYTPDFRTNATSLPTDERTVVLRTFRNRRAPYPDHDTWHFMVHPMSDFLERLALGYWRSTEIIDDVLRTLGDSGVTTITSSAPRRHTRTPAPEAATDAGSAPSRGAEH